MNPMKVVLNENPGYETICQVLKGDLRSQGSIKEPRSPAEIAFD